MIESTSPLQSRLGNRLLLAFMLSVLLPVVVAAWTLQRTVAAELEQQARIRLHEGAKAQGFALLQRLQTFAYALSAAPSTAIHLTRSATYPGPFLSITHRRPSASDPIPVLRQGTATWLTIQSRAVAGPRIFLNARAGGSEASGPSILVAEIEPDSLWKALDGVATESEAEVLVLDDDGALLYGSSQGVTTSALVRQMQAVPPASGEFEWHSAGENFIASRWTLFLKPSFGIRSWHVVLSEPRAAVLAPLAAFRRSFLSILLLSLLVALSLGIVEIRRHLRPLQALRAGAERVAGQDFTSRVEITSNDEFQAVAEALNSMAGRLGGLFTELSRANSDLRAQIREREEAEQALRQSEDQLRQAQKMEAIGTLAGGVAHDFNNLLTVISSYTDLALSSTGPDDPLHQDLEEVAGAARRAASLTRQLLTFSRKQVVDLKILDLNEVIRGSERLLRRLIGAQVDFRVELSDGEAWTFGDQGQLDQVLMNLAVNARDAMPDGGTLTIRTASTTLDSGQADRFSLAPGAFVTLSVEDTGVGMSELTQARIFEPFFTTKPPGQGTGLGLSTVYGIVKQSGGSVQLHSQVGAGTRFTIYLRGVSPASGLMGARPARASHHRGEGSILLVEDELPVRQLTRRILEDAGYTVLSAEDGEEALRLAYCHTGRIDLLLTDVVMPRMGGKRLATSLAQTRAGLRTLYMSGYYDDQHQVNDLLGDTVGLLQKPFQPHQLLEAVARILVVPATTCGVESASGAASPA